VSQSDEKPRGINPREASQLRALLGSEPSSGYAFHDAGRVERVRPGRAPGAGSVKQTLLGVTAPEPLQSGRPAGTGSDAANDQGSSGSASWPPLPHVPNELLGAVEHELPESDLEISDAALRTPSARPAGSNPTPLPVVGGAIWQALPSVVDTAGAVEPEPAGVVSAPLELALEPAHGAPGRNSNPNPWRGSMAELDTSPSAYGDPRVLKYEPLVQRTAWEQLHNELSREPELSPVLELLRIIARRETLPSEERQNAVQLSQEAIATLARLLEVPEASPTALLLGKRLLRKNPGWARVPSPGTGLSAGMLLAGIAAGAGIGWLVTRLIL
jgi:hypothetical protein